jgi:hypothetical protein
MQTINKNKAKELIKDSKGLIFSTSFIKKDNTNFNGTFKGYATP